MRYEPGRINHIEVRFAVLIASWYIGYRRIGTIMSRIRVVAESIQVTTRYLDKE